MKQQLVILQVLCITLKYSFVQKEHFDITPYTLPTL
jgi:hypothetical protein